MIFFLRFLGTCEPKKLLQLAGSLLELLFMGSKPQKNVKGMFGSTAPFGTRSFGVGFGVVGLSRAHAEGTRCQRVGAVGAGGALLPKYLGVCYRVRGLGERPQKGNSWRGAGGTGIGRSGAVADGWVSFLAMF